MNSFSLTDQEIIPLLEKCHIEDHSIGQFDVKTGDTIYACGDFHGDFEACLVCLQDLCGVLEINNGKYIKGLLLTSLQGYSIYKFSDYNKNNQISKRNTYAWWILGLYFYGVIDAYVDSSLKNFPNNEKKDEVNK